MEIPNHICSNPTCGKPFTKPLKVENLSSGAIVIYEACPHCLTEITTKGNVPSIKHKPNAIEEKKEKVNTQGQSSTETQGCKHYFGYLSKRSSRDAPPEECIVCPKIVQCMLKGMIG